MTHLQIERANMLISKAQAEEQARTNRVHEDIDWNKNFETMRHNVASEAYNYDALAETARHNRAGEFVSAETLAEQTRHNQAAESLERSNQMETVRHNKSVEAETARSNRANESIKETANAISQARSDWEKDVAEVKNLISKESNALKRVELEQQLTKINNDYDYQMKSLENQLNIARENNNMNQSIAIMNAVTNLANGSGKNIYYWVKALDDGTKVWIPRSLRKN